MEITDKKMNEIFREYIRDEIISLPQIKNKYLPKLIEDVLIKFIILKDYDVKTGVSEELDIFYNKRIHIQEKEQSMNGEEYSNLMSGNIDRLYKKIFGKLTLDYSRLRNELAHELEKNDVIPIIGRAVGYLFKIVYMYENDSINFPSFINPFASSRMMNEIKAKWNSLKHKEEKLLETKIEYITNEIIKEVPVTKYVEITKEVPIETIKLIEVEVIKEVPVEKIVEIVKEVPVIDEELLNRRLRAALEAQRDTRYENYFNSDSEHIVPRSSTFEWVFNKTPYKTIKGQTLVLNDATVEQINSGTGFPGRISLSTFSEMYLRKSIFSDFKASTELLKNKVNKNTFDNQAWTKAINNAIKAEKDEMKFEPDFMYKNSMTEYLGASSKVHFDGNLIHFFNLVSETKGYDFENKYNIEAWIDVPLRYIKTRYGTGKVRIHFYTYDEDGNISAAAAPGNYNLNDSNFSDFDFSNRIIQIVNKLKGGSTPIVPAK